MQIFLYVTEKALDYRQYNMDIYHACVSSVSQ